MKGDFGKTDNFHTWTNEVFLMKDQRIVSVKERFSLERKPFFLLPILCTLPVFFVLYFHIPQYIPPAEDATILFRFSENWAETGVISYNPNGEKAEGATDFLWMALLAFGAWMHLDTYLCAHILSVTGLLGSYWLVCRLIFRINQSRWIPFVVMFAFVFNSQGVAAIQGFSVYFYGFFLLLTAYFFLEKKRKALLITAVITGMVRPDGLVVVVPIVVTYLLIEVKVDKSLLSETLFWGLIPGWIYFLWRWAYFGYFFPLPFYVKAGGSAEIFRWESFLYEIKYLLKYLWPLLVGIGTVAIHSWREKHTDSLKEPLILFVAFVVFPLIFFSCVSQEQNVADRFMYPVHLGILLTFLLLFAARKGKIRKLGVIMGGVYLFFSFTYFLLFLKGTLEIAYDTDYRLGKALSALSPRRMAVTEAGRLPYYTDWETLDMWGLNTPHLAQRLIGEADLKAFQPDFLYIDKGLGYRELLHQVELPYASEKVWENMPRNAFKYAWESGAYEYYLQPFKRPVDLPNWMENYLAIIQQGIDWKTALMKGEEKTAYDMFHLYAIRKNAQNHEALIQLLKDQGAIDFDTYLDQYEPP